MESDDDFDDFSPEEFLFLREDAARAGTDHFGMPARAPAVNQERREVWILTAIIVGCMIVGIIVAYLARGVLGVSYAVGSGGSDPRSVEIFPDADNWQALQDLWTGCTSITLPPGRWPIYQTFNMRSARTLAGQGVDQTTLVMVGGFAGPTLGLGGQGTWPSGFLAAPNATIRGLTVEQTVNSSTNNKCIWSEGGDNLLVDNVRVKGSSYEGIVTSSNLDGVTVRNFEAWDCGNGGPAYFLSTAGINCTSRNQLVENFRTLRCGQGVEGGNSRNEIFRKGVILGPGTATPSLGVNIGSTGRGIYQVTVEDVTVRGYDSSISMGPNGIGRLCGCIVQRCDVDKGINFSGGQMTNAVPGQPGEGPDTEGSFILNNIVRINGLSDASILYNTGPSSPSYDVYGREPLTIRGNSFYYDGTPQTTPSIGFAGKIVATCVVEGNFLYGLNAAPSRGDIASFTSGSNPAIPGMPNMTYRGNIAFNRSGMSRPFSAKIEGA